MHKRFFTTNDLINAREYDEQNYLFIDTIRFKSQISQACANIHQEIGMDFISLCLTIPNGMRFILSNNPGKIAVPYHIHGLSRIDNVFSPNRYDKCPKGNFLVKNLPNDEMGRLFERIHNEQFGIDSIQGFSRKAFGHQLIVIFSQNLKTKSIDSTAKTKKELHDYTIKFFEHVLPHYSMDKSSLRYSRFSQDATFRKKFIYGDVVEITPEFTERELLCLYWSKMGKTAEEISIILSLSKATVRGYLENIREKYDVSCLQEAITLATEQRIIS